MKTDEKCKPVLYISQERTDGYFHLYADFMLQETDNDGKTRYVNPHHHEYENLQVSCQGNDEARTLREPESQSLYGWELRFTGYRPNFTEIETAYKAMKKIEKAVSKISDTDGYARSYGEYVLRIAKAAGIDHAIIRNENTHYRGYPDMEFRKLSLGDMRNHLHYLESVWIASLRERYQNAA